VEATDNSSYRARFPEHSQVSQAVLEETTGDYIGGLVEYRRIVVAGGGIVPGCYRVGRWGHIANLEPGHCRRGLARLLMKTMLDWCIARRMTMSLWQLQTRVGRYMIPRLQTHF